MASPERLDKAPPALASFAKITLAASGDIGIASDLTVSETPCTFSETKATQPCTRNPGNVLGIYSQNGNVIVRTTTPRNVNIHAAIMASTGQATVENYNSRPQSGSVKLIGSSHAPSPHGLVSVWKNERKEFMESIVSRVSQIRPEIR